MIFPRPLGQPVYDDLPLEGTGATAPQAFREIRSKSRLLLFAVPRDSGEFARADKVLSLKLRGCRRKTQAH